MRSFIPYGVRVTGTGIVLVTLLLYIQGSSSNNKQAGDLTRLSLPKIEMMRRAYY